MKKRQDGSIYPTQDNYNAAYAKSYWSQNDAIECIEGLGGALYDSLYLVISIAKILVFESNKSKPISSSNSIRLETLAQPIFQNCVTAREIVALMYYYRQNWMKQNELIELDKNSSKVELELPDNIPDEYAKSVLAWYKLNPEDFLAVLFPLIESYTLRLGDAIQALLDVPNLQPILLLEGEMTYTLIHASNSLFMKYKIVNEEILLLKSHVEARKR